MKQYFRFYINFEQSNWVKLLSMIEFVYNNVINAFTNMTFFEINQDYHSRIFFENNQNKKVKSMFAKDNAKHLQNLLNVLKVNLMKIQIKQTHYQNKRIMFKQYIIKTYIMLNDKNIRIKRNKKLKWKIFESFKVMKTIDDRVYRLNILKHWRIHNVFHVSLLKKVNVKKRKKSIELIYQVNDINIEKNEFTKKLYEVETIKNNYIFVVDKIFDKSYSQSSLYFFIQWENYEK